MPNDFTTIDLYDRSTVATPNDNRITPKLEINMLTIALKRNPNNGEFGAQVIKKYKNTIMQDMVGYLFFQI